MYQNKDYQKKCQRLAEKRAYEMHDQLKAAVIALSIVLAGMTAILAAKSSEAEENLIKSEKMAIEMYERQLAIDSLQQIVRENEAAEWFATNLPNE